MMTESTSNLPNESTFSERLTELLTKSGRGSASRLASYCSIDKGYVSKLKAGGRENPDQNVVNKIAQFFRVSPQYLLTGESFEADIAVIQESSAIYETSTALKVKDYQHAFESMVDGLPTPVLYDRLTELITEAENGDSLAFNTARSILDALKRKTST